MFFKAIFMFSKNLVVVIKLFRYQVFLLLILMEIFISNFIICWVHLHLEILLIFVILILNLEIFLCMLVKVNSPTLYSNFKNLTIFCLILMPLCFRQKTNF